MTSSCLSRSCVGRYLGGIGFAAEELVSRGVLIQSFRVRLGRLRWSSAWCNSVSGGECRGSVCHVGGGARLVVVGTSAEQDAARRQLETGRVTAFSDGVFAIIITILVLDIKVPELGSGRSLREAMSDAEPTLVSWVISFLIVGMYWSWHRGAFTRVRFADLGLVWLNLLFLLPVSLIPFAASALGEYSDDPIALRLYGAVLIAASLTRLTITWYLVRHPRMLWESFGTTVARLEAFSASLQILMYVIAMAVADVAPLISRVLYLLVPAVYLGLIAILRTDRRTRIAAEELA